MKRQIDPSIQHHTYIEYRRKTEAWQPGLPLPV